MKKIMIILITFLIFYVDVTADSSIKKWIKYENNPVLGDNSTGSVFDPHVIYDNGIYKMYVSWRDKKSIAVSESIDGINWSSLKIVLKNNEKDFEKEVNRATVLYKDNVYHMWYTGQKDGVSKIGYAKSIDGYNFEKLDNPVLYPEYDFEKNSVMNPHVIYDEQEKLYKMWYATGDIYEPDVIGYAESKDGINWIKNDKPILKPSEDKTKLDSYKIGGCDVHKLSNNLYIMFYIGYTDIDTGRIFMATSKDGINWVKYNYPIVESDKNKFDSDSCYKPSMIYDSTNNRFMLWYNGRNYNKEYIGLTYYKF